MKTLEQWMEKADAAFDAERYEEALAAYDQAIILDPANWDAYFKKGNALNDRLT